MNYGLAIFLHGKRGHRLAGYNYGHFILDYTLKRVVGAKGIDSIGKKGMILWSVSFFCCFVVNSHNYSENSDRFSH